ncbi:MAG: hypothetical protein ACM3P1_08465 [Candidatus Saccharibacteria bacterium]
MEKKNLNRHLLPQYLGQACLATFCLWNAIPPGALSNYTVKLSILWNLVI